MALIRPAQRLADYKRINTSSFDSLCKLMEQARIRRGTMPGLPEWNDWCYVPSALAWATIRETAGLPPAELSRKGKQIYTEALFATGLATWRVTQGVYRIDPTVFDYVWNTPVSGDLPVEVLTRLPEWCCYIEVPEDSELGRTPLTGFPEASGLHKTRLHGFFVYLDDTIANGPAQLIVIYDFDVKMIIGELPFTSPSIEQCIRNKYAAISDVNTELERRFFEPLVSLTLYLCSVNAEISDEQGEAPANPQPKKTKKGLRIFPAERPRQWNVAFRLGAALRGALARTDTEAAGDRDTNGDESHERASVRPHIRRAHWHSFWTGAQSAPDQRRIVAKWLPPIPVNVSAPDDLVPTIRPVKPDH